MKRVIQLIALFSFAGILLSSSCNGNGNNRKLNTRSIGTLETRVFGDLEMLAPKGINKQYYNEIGFTDDNNYESEYRNVFISVDEFSQTEVSDFFKYYGDMSDKQADQKFMVKYANMKRIETLEEYTQGDETEIESNRGEKIIVRTIKGKQNSYGDENTFIQACVKLKNTYFFIQLVSLTDDMKYYHKDFMEMLKSVRHY